MIFCFITTINTGAPRRASCISYCTTLRGAPQHGRAQRAVQVQLCVRSVSARPHTPANPAAAMARPTATTVLACRERAHTAFIWRRAAATAARASPTPHRGTARARQGNPARRSSGAESGASGLSAALALRPRPSRARGPRGAPGRAQQRPHSLTMSARARHSAAGPNPARRKPRPLP